MKIKITNPFRRKSKTNKASITTEALALGNTFIEEREAIKRRAQQYVQPLIAQRGAPTAPIKGGTDEGN